MTTKQEIIDYLTNISANLEIGTISFKDETSFYFNPTINISPYVNKLGTFFMNPKTIIETTIHLIEGYKND